MTLLVCEKVLKFIKDRGRNLNQQEQALVAHHRGSVNSVVESYRIRAQECFDIAEKIEYGALAGTFIAPADGGLVEALRIARQWIHNGEAPIGWSLDRIDEVLNGARPSHSGCVANEDRIQYCAHGVPYAVPCNECFPLPSSPEVKP